MSETKGRIIIVGDFFPTHSNVDLFKEGNIQELLGEKITSLFSGADLRVCNLEGSLTNSTEKCVKTGPLLTAPPDTIKAYKKLGIDCCCLANNHITDAGHQGVVDTLNVLKKENILAIGAGLDKNHIQKYAKFKIANRDICLYNVAETMYNEPTPSSAGASLYDEYLVCKEIEVLKKNTDYLMVVYHGGIEKFRYPSPETRKRFHRMADSGADMILSQHTHCVGCEEIYNKSYLLYGQGNFLFPSRHNEYTDTGLIVEILFEGSNVLINKHLIDAVNDKVRYDNRQNLNDFCERSLRVKDEDFVRKEFEKFCIDNVRQYLVALKGKFLFRRVIRKLSPSLYNKMTSFSRYEKKQALFLIHMLRSEQNRETALTAFVSLFKKNYGAN